MRAGLEVPGSAGVHRAAQRRRRALGPPGYGRPTPCRLEAAAPSRTWIMRICRTIPWRRRRNGPAGLPVPGYAIDDQTAIKVIDGTAEVVSEGHWKLSDR